MVKKGCMFRCACDPPTLEIMPGFIASRFELAAPYRFAPTLWATTVVFDGDAVDETLTDAFAL
jgi:hypothetical protein